MNNILTIKEFKGCGKCDIVKETNKCSNINIPVKIKFLKDQKADCWGRIVTVFAKGEIVNGHAVIKDNVVYCVSAQSNIYEDYDDFILDTSSIEVQLIK